MASHALLFSVSLLVPLFLCCVLAKGDMTVIPSKNGADHRGRSLQSTKVVNVLRYGAYGDGLHDDTKALSKAWSAACSSSLPGIVLIPKGKKFLTKHVTFSGPCKSSIKFMIQGTLVAPPKRSYWIEDTIRHWVLFINVRDLTVTGGGTIDGNGKIWWQSSCKVNSKLPCRPAPTALTFYSCTNLKVDNLKLLNSQQIHMSVERCTNVRVSRLLITAPGTSPNTDGIHIAHSKDVKVYNCAIKTGDDCMSIEDGTKNLHVKNIVCGPGHGISIGSLGDQNSEAQVTNITINGVRLHGTTNGARIKTWQGGRGYAKNIVFENIIMDNVWNPIIIDQNYCDSTTPCNKQKSAVEVSNVLFKNIRGTSASRDAIKLSCSRTVPCHGIALHNVKLTLKRGNGNAKSTCQNAKYRTLGTVMPQPCILKN
ncbi:polygalacturonase-like [Lolium rigidum]|uniref:polygalacturonase-like n=1 Tax=Lolium rigidum TaxID=89674 RepID=UPI001F5CB5BE|nr:polygalacturonase-like [Lolium rigidum]